MRQIFVSGSSNSMKKIGWVSELAARLDDGFVLKNISIGSASTLMGLYRLMTQGDIAEGDIVIWEYAVNEQAYSQRGAHMPDCLIAHLGLFLQECSRLGVYVVPVILPRKREMETPGAFPYLDRLRAFFASAGLKPIEASELIRQLMDEGMTLDDLYEDPMHCAVDSPFIGMLVDQVLKAVQGDLKDGVVTGLPDQGQVEIVDAFPAQSVPCRNAAWQGLRYKLDRPIHMSVTGRLLGIVYVSLADSPGMKLSLGGKPIGRFAMQMSAADQRSFLLKVICPEFHGLTVDSTGQEDLILERPGETDGEYHTWIGTQWRADAASDLSEDGVVALIFQR